MSCDVLVIAPHPDDAELHVGATIARHTRLGAQVVMVDCTHGEMASRGDPETRATEAAAAAAALGVTVRENLGLPDGGLDASDLSQRLAVVDALRRHRPRLVLGIGAAVRHPDHRACHALVRDAVKAAAFHRLSTPSAAPAVLGLRLLCYEAELAIVPHCIVGAEAVDAQRKAASLACYGSQFNPSHQGPATALAQPDFLEWIAARGRTWGYHAQAAYGEAFTAPEPLICNDLRHFLALNA